MHHHTGPILILEDQPLIALDLEQQLAAAGFDNLTLLTSGAQAEAWLGLHRPDAAIIDIALCDGDCTDVARTLLVRTIPFIVHSGSPGDGADPVFGHGRWVGKPARPGYLVTELQIALAASCAARVDCDGN
ncbi:response regulator [Hoeflea ulvae]|uniref:Response regulator n=1 Tax=Hoeflea ulvae TaxID=2983764 RepID=A0ABT3YBH9_9HYPH|nr:response regulator [Hoeflea ulvae]MCY0093162.1 response regulator [Hoeflea ulvae]